jgi:hypothetical protein
VSDTAITIGADNIPTMKITANQAPAQSLNFSNLTQQAQSFGFGGLQSTLNSAQNAVSDGAAAAQGALSDGSGSGFGLPSSQPSSGQIMSGQTPADGDTAQRAVLSALSPDDVYGANGPNAGGIMAPLAQTNGMIFPYTPSIQFSQSVSYQETQLVHSNYDFASYTRTPTCTLSVTGKFTVQNQNEGAYALAAIHFLRTVSKSYFGEIDAKAGTAGLPPPVLLFSAYGTYIFNRLRCVLKSHSWSYDEAMDTVPIIVNNNIVRLPAVFSITTELMVVQTPQRVRTQFSFEAFATGSLMEGDGGWI